MNKPFGYIYTITNKNYGYVYVGQTMKEPVKRWREHVLELNKNFHTNPSLQRDWNIFGSDDFIFDVVEKCELSKLDEREVHWIAFYVKDRFVYNRGPRRLLSNAVINIIRKQLRLVSAKRNRMYKS